MRPAPEADTFFSRPEPPSARAADACAATGSAASLASTSRPLAAPVLARAAGPKLASALPAAKLHPSRTGGVLGADFTQTLRDPTSVSPVLLILLAIAICLLGLAALPRPVVASPVLAEHLTHRRLELALAGTSTLLVVVLAYMIF